MTTTPTAFAELPDLDACPFCGGTEAFVERADYSAAFVVCDSRVDEHSVCMARGPIGIQDDDGEEIPGQAAAIRGWNKAAALARRAQPESTGPDALDAARWRALLGSGRIRPLGSAGLNEPMPNNYAHMGLEIWTTGDWSDCSPALAKRLAYDQEVGIDWLTKYADIARAAQLDDSQGEGK